MERAAVKLIAIISKHPPRLRRIAGYHPNGLFSNSSASRTKDAEPEDTTDCQSFSKPIDSCDFFLHAFESPVM